MQGKKILIILLIIVLGFGLWGWRQVAVKQAEVEALRGANTVSIFNQRVLDFMSLFVENVLCVKGEIDFETRLKLENSVRNTGDVELLAQWKKFIDSPDEVVAQDEVKALLKLLVAKISLIDKFLL